MKKCTIIKVIALVLCTFYLIAGCSTGNKPQKEKVDLNSLSMDELIAKAKDEGVIESVGMPDDWANWKDSWEAITKKYGIKHYDTDMSSAEEIAIFKAEANSPTKDIGDVGHAYSKIAIQEDVLRGYKPSTWDSIPDWAKDPDGRWILSYTGTVAFASNINLTGGAAPTSWADIRKGDYMVSPGNVVGGASSQAMVLSCAIAMGGGLDNVQPGIDFFKELAAAGRIDPGDINQDRLATGEVAVMAGKYDYSGLGYRDAINSTNSGVHIEVTIPQDGAITTGYCLVFNKYSPHPHAAALAIEYLLSDEGQIDRARGYAKPVRNVKLPDDVAQKMLDDSQYKNAVPITDPEALSKACSEISRLWEEEVLPLIN